MTTLESSRLFYPQMRKAVQDLFHHSARIYWADMLLTLTIAYAASLVFLHAPLYSWPQLAAFPVAAFALFRLGSFIHEVTHLRHGELRGFAVGWNILAGIPIAMPSYFYVNHIDHHNSNHYGTGRDGEYLPLGGGTFGQIAGYMAQSFYLPLWTAVRFMVLGPVSFLHPRLRQWVLEHWSSFVINFRYRREVKEAGRRERMAWAAMDVAVGLRLWAIPITAALGLVSWNQIVLIYLLGVASTALNSIRTLVAHHYRGDGEPMTHEEQLRDSVTITGDRVLTELFFPVGLRYHALHHLFPALPYHNLGKAHRRLMRELPPDAVYRQSVYAGFWQALGELWADAAQARGQRSARAVEWYRKRRRIIAEH